MWVIIKRNINRSKNIAEPQICGIYSQISMKSFAANCAQFFLRKKYQMEIMPG